MSKKIILGTTPLSELHEFFRFTDDYLEHRQARLFPGAKTEHEQHTTSIFLACLAAVKEYRESLLFEIGIKKIKHQNVNLHVYTEISNSQTQGTEQPDGLIIVTSGKGKPIIEWAAFVECKIGKAPLIQDQINRYMNFARDIGINDLVTISNDLVTTPIESPMNTNGKNFNLYHWSWTYLRVLAKHLITTEQVEDEDHIFILKELRRYLDSHKKINNFIDMGPEWSDNTLTIRSLELTQKIKPDILNSLVSSYQQEEKDLSLQLTDKTINYITVLPTDKRASQIAEMLQNKRSIISTFIINHNNKIKFFVEVNFIKRTIDCWTQISIDKGKSRSQTTILIKKLDKEAGTTGQIKIKAFYKRNKTIYNSNVSLEQLINEKIHNDPYSILDAALGDEIKYFKIEMNDSISSRFNNRKVFISNIEAIAERFVTQVMESLYK